MIMILMLILIRMGNCKFAGTVENIVLETQRCVQQQEENYSYFLERKKTS